MADWLDNTRAWVRDKDEAATNALRYYLGPAFAPVEGMANMAAMVSPAQDFFDMQQGGENLVSALQNRDPLAATLGLGTMGAGLAGAVLPGSVGAIDNAVQSAKKGIKAYHGSPHDFDQFSLDHIGTGEGGRLLGDGLNFSDNPKVADYYHEQLSGGRGKRYEVNIDANPEDFLDFNAPIKDQGESVRAAVAKKFDLGPVEPELYMNGDKGGLRWAKDGNAGIKRFGNIEKSGNYYTAKAGKKDLGVFDTPKQAGDALRGEMVSRGIEWTGGDLTGHDVFNALGGREGGSAALSDLGIPGSKMQGSYNVGDSTDYVVFDDNLVNVLRKYALPGMIGGGLGASYYGSDQGQY